MVWLKEFFFALHIWQQILYSGLQGYITTDNLRSFHDLFPVMVKITSDTSFCFILLPKG